MGWGVWVCEALDPKELKLLVIVISPPTLSSHLGPLQDQWALLASRLSAPKLWLFYNSLAHRTSSTLFSLIYQRSVASFVFISCAVWFSFWDKTSLWNQGGWGLTMWPRLTSNLLQSSLLRLESAAPSLSGTFEIHVFSFNQHLSKSKDRTLKEAVIRKQEKLAEQ